MTYRALTRNQTAALEFLHEWICDEEISPSNHEIAAAVGCHIGNVPSLLATLELRGLIGRTRRPGYRGAASVVEWVELPDGRSAYVDLFDEDDA